jgi:hypothetical protein
MTEQTGHATCVGVMLRLLRWLLLALLAMLAAPLLAWFCIRQFSAYVAIETDVLANPSGSCVLKSYVRNYQPLGIVGRVGSGWSSRYFYRVYDRDGDLLATSEWTLSEYEIDDFSPEWHGQMALYPTTDGWASFWVPQCRQPAAEAVAR